MTEGEIQQSMNPQEIGEVLKNARLEQKIKLEAIQKETNIRAAYLKAVEDGDYSTLPGDVYAKAYIKTYAEMLGLDSTTLLKNFNGAGKGHNILNLEEMQRPIAARDEQKPAIWLVAIAAIAAIGAYLYSQHEVKPETVEVAKSTSDEVIEYYQNDNHQLNIIALEPTEIILLEKYAITGKTHQLDFGEVMNIKPLGQKLSASNPSALEFYVDGQKTYSIQGLQGEDGSFVLDMAKLLAVTEINNGQTPPAP